MSGFAFEKEPLVFLGYRAKKPWPPEDGWDSARETGVVEVCSVSDCLAKPPPGWSDRWDFNRASCYSTAEMAWATVPDFERNRYRLFAYWLLPATTDKQGQWSHVPSSSWLSEQFPELPPEPGPDWTRIGFDVVSRQPHSLGWGHSPLSCNLMATQVPVNRFCLVDRLEDATRLVERWNRGGEGVEPEVYCAIAVATAS